MTQLPMQTVWLALAILFGIIEAATLGLTSIWFAVGALAAMICALLHGPIWLQVAVFVVVSGITVILTRNIARSYFNRDREATNADRIIGGDALVMEEIDNLRATGAVRAGGSVWTARSKDDHVIPKDVTVRVVAIEGVKAIVEEKA